MKKKIITVLLAVIMILGVMSLVSFADSGKSEIYDVFSEYQIEQNTIIDDYQMEVIVTSYAYDDSMLKGTEGNGAAILYVINHCGESIGTEEDEAIVADYLEMGYVVAVLDYQNNPSAVSPNIEASVEAIHEKIIGNNKYIGGKKLDGIHAFVLPAGYRLARNVQFFDLKTEGSRESLEYSVEQWNTREQIKKNVYNRLGSSVVTKNTENGTETYSWVNGDAESIYDIIKRDGSYMTEADLIYAMDIIYPSKPIKEAPVSVLASSRTSRRTEGLINQIGFLFRGYTIACYDHEFIPYLNQEIGGWGYITDFYTIQSMDGTKMHTAAIRCVKYYADVYGYSKDKIGAYGHSKASWCSLLSNPYAENLPESGGVYEAMGEQPFLKDINGNPLDSTVTCVYHSMGNGSARFEKYLTAQNVPTMICNGQYDSGTGNSYWENEKAAYRKSGIEFIAVDMIDGGHHTPKGSDPVYGYNMSVAFAKFFDYYLKDTAPEILYTSVNGGQLKDLVTTTTHFENANHKAWEIVEGEQLFVQFVAPVTERSFLASVTLTKDSDGTAAEGYWYAEGNGNRWIFDGALEEGESYTLQIADNTICDKYGRFVAEGTEVSFVK